MDGRGIIEIILNTGHRQITIPFWRKSQITRDAEHKHRQRTYIVNRATSLSGKYYHPIHIKLICIDHIIVHKTSAIAISSRTKYSMLFSYNNLYAAPPNPLFRLLSVGLFNKRKLHSQEIKYTDQCDPLDTIHGKFNKCSAFNNAYVAMASVKNPYKYNLAPSSNKSKSNTEYHEYKCRCSSTRILIESSKTPPLKNHMIHLITRHSLSNITVAYDKHILTSTFVESTVNSSLAVTLDLQIVIQNPKIRNYFGKLKLQYSAIYLKLCINNQSGICKYCWTKFTIKVIGKFPSRHKTVNLNKALFGYRSHCSTLVMSSRAFENIVLDSENNYSDVELESGIDSTEEFNITDQDLDSTLGNISGEFGSLYVANTAESSTDTKVLTATADHNPVTNIPGALENQGTINPTPKSNKRGREFNSSTSSENNQPPKIRKMFANMFPHAAIVATNAIVVDIVSNANEGELISDANLKTLGSSLNRALFSDEGFSNLKFEFSGPERGKYRTVCSNTATRDWVVAAIPHLEGLWPGAQLTTIVAGPPPVLVRATVNMAYPTVEPNDFFTIIATQNPTIDTSNWKLFNRNKPDKGRQLWVIGVEETTVQPLRDLGARPYFGMTRIRINLP